MAFYDHFSKSEYANMSRLGQHVVLFRNRFFIRHIKEHLHKESFSLLEIGPGKGFFAKACRDSNVQYAAIEANEHIAQQLHAEGFNVKTALVPPIPLDRQFDVIAFHHVLEHMKNADQVKELLTSCHEHLEDDGLLVISAPDITRCKEDFFAVDYSHEYPVSARRLEQLFFDHAYDVVLIKHYALFFTGSTITAILAYVGRMAWATGLLHLLFRKKAYKVKIGFLTSLFAIARKRKIEKRPTI